MCVKHLNPSEIKLSVILLPIELSHGTFVWLVGGIVTLTTGLVDEVAANFLQPLRILNLLEAHW